MSLFDSIQGLSTSFLQNFKAPGVDAEALKDLQKAQTADQVDFAKTLKAFGVPDAPDLEALQKAGIDAQQKLGGLIDRTPVRIGSTGPQFEDVLSSVVNYVDQKDKAGQVAMRDIFLGKSNNLHAAIIAQEESKLAFAMLVETRNKTVESIQELMRINVG